MAIPKHQVWMQNTTLGVLRPRSTPLKAVDDAILQYERGPTQQALFRIKNAFEDWKRSKGIAWKQSDRNRTQAITQLDDELSKVASYGAFQAKTFTPQELAALAFMRQQRAQVIRSIFEGKKVTLKAAKLKERLSKAGDDVRSSASKANDFLKGKGKPSTAAPGMAEQIKNKMIDAAKGYFGVEGLAALGDLGGFVISIIERTALSVPPVVGHIKDGYDLFTGWAKVGSLYVQQRSIGERSYAIDTGVPAAAFAALLVCMKEETKSEAVSATNATVSFALKTGLAAVDGGTISGPVVGAASALAEFMHSLALLAIEWRATKAVNTALTGGQLDMRLFRTYPLMGCYLMVSATLSDLIPVESIGTPGWMDYIENMKKNQFDEIYNAAGDLIEGSPWEIVGLPKRAKGTSLGLIGEAKRIWSTVSPLKDLNDLRTLR